MTSYPKKLIEVALPLEEINVASAREKSIRHGHPSTLHLWWARRPLAAARAVLFGQLVDDPSGYVEELRQDAEALRLANRDLRERLKLWRERKALYDKAVAGGIPNPPDPGEEPTLDAVLVERERERLFSLIRQLVQWENTTNESVLEPAREEIRRSWRRTCRREGRPEETPLPAFHDPFAGGGAIPLEAQRLGLEAHASDLNPVAVLINKAMIEIPPRFAGRPPVNPESGAGQLGTKTWRGAQGLAEDVRCYGKWMREQAEKRIGHLYPKILVTEAMAEERPDLKPLVGRELTVIAWLWARTVKSPNPAFAEVDVPLASTFMLSTKAGKEAWVEPVIENGGYRFAVHSGKPKDPAAAKAGTKLARGANFGCVMSGTPLTGDYIKAEGKAGRMDARLMAIVAEGERGRVYLSPTPEHEAAAKKAKPTWKPEGEIAKRMTGGNCTPYGLESWGDLFTDRQLVALTTFADLVQEAREQIHRDALAAGMSPDPTPLRDGGFGATAYAEAVGVYLGFVVDRLIDFNSSIAGWIPVVQATRNTFARQAIPMTWDFAELNIFGQWLANYDAALEKIIKPQQIAFPMQESKLNGVSRQEDAQRQTTSSGKLISTDPPYYDNIGYADLSDFFYVWLRRTLQPIYPELFGTLAVPKAEELVATPYRHGGKDEAEAFFLYGMTHAMSRLCELAIPNHPVTIYYAFKQSEKSGDSGETRTGWETFLEAVIRAGFNINGTWPMRTELANKILGQNANILASSIILVCRKRSPEAPMATRRELVQALQRELPTALRNLQHGNVAPVDLPQSSIGPGMAVFTRYSKVVEADGSAMSVRTALQLINKEVMDFLSQQEAQMDDWTRFAVTWFSQNGFKAGKYGDALNLATAFNVSVEGVAEAGILESGGGKVRLFRPVELPEGWDPATDSRLTVWEIVHQLARALDKEGEQAAAVILGKIGALADDAKALCYRLYTLCEQKKWAEEAIPYNTLIAAWPELTRLAADRATASASATQGDLDFAT